MTTMTLTTKFMRHSRALPIAAAALIASATPAAAEFGPVAGSFEADVFNAAGELETQAGAHPYAATTSFEFNVRPDGLSVDQYSRNIRVTLPAGFVGNPTATPRCSKADFNAMVSRTSTCPVASQVGVTTIRQLISGFTLVQNEPVFSVEPARGTTAEFGFVVGTVPVRMTAGLVADGEYRLRVNLKDISQGIPTQGAALTLWGDPSDPRHDSERGFVIPGFSCAQSNYFAPGSCAGQSIAGLLPRKPFLTNPTSCRGPQTTDWSADSWERSGSFVSTSYTTSVGAVGCERLTFEPGFRANLDTTRPDAPTGLLVSLDFPQNEDPDGLATAQLKRATVTFPEGMTISPSSADGLGACTDEQLGLGTLNTVGCPVSAKIGTVTARTPLLEEQLEGGIYLRSQASDDPASGRMFRIAIVLENEARGLIVKLPGAIAADRLTGRLRATFDDNPQLPVSNIALRFKSGARAPLATPPTCGEKQIDAELTSWAGHVVNRQTRFMVDCGPIAPLVPSFRAGSVSAQGGAYSPFALRVGRADAQPVVKGLELSLPSGLTAALASATPCSEGAIALVGCPASSRVGAARITAGPGSNPLGLDGDVYLTGPYRGAPIGLAVTVRAVAGPFDLGTVVVRQALRIDRRDAHVTVVSDPLPTIVQGVPVRLRTLAVDIDRPQFMLNPTSCSEKRISGVVAAEGGARTSVGSRFRATACASLSYAPKMSLKVGARGKVTRGKRTPLEVTLTMPRGNANNRAVAVTLPLAVNARLDVVNKRRACTLEQFQADRCPMTVGTATAVTPLLRDPLRGPAYFVYTPERRLPDLVVRLRGQIDIDLVGKVTIARDLRLRTTFDAIPDQPISKFRLSLASGSRNGPVGLTRNVCSGSVRKSLKVKLSFTSQSKKRVTRDQKISVAGCRKIRRRTGSATR
jgi:hypothetical protein